MEEYGEVRALCCLSAMNQRAIGDSGLDAPLFASAKTTRALTSSTHLILKPPLSFSKSRKMAWMSRVFSLDISGVIQADMKAGRSLLG